MAFTNVWDNTTPADTSLASGLGLVIRNLQVDISERMRVLSGRLADREDFEAVFGDTNRGVLFYSTDERILYRWDGASWVVLEQFKEFNIIDAAATNSTFIQSAVPGILNSLTTYAAGAIDVGDVIIQKFTGNHGGVAALNFLVGAQTTGRVFTLPGVFFTYDLMVHFTTTTEAFISGMVLDTSDAPTLEQAAVFTVPDISVNPISVGVEFDAAVNDTLSPRQRYTELRKV